MILSGETRQRIDRCFADYDSTTAPGCALGIAEGGELAYVRGYGMADIECGVPVDPRTSRSTIESCGARLPAIAV